jgi:hypothetical protein
MFPLEFRVDCECGRFVMVKEGSAGAKLGCSCGRTILVPSLKELRLRAGLPAYSLSPELVIEHLLLAGELPSRRACAVCGADTDDRARVVTECERVWISRSGGFTWAHLLVFLFFPILLWLLLLQKPEQRKYGKDKIYALPLAVCRGCLKKLRSRRTIKECLRKEPIYDRLLDKFPDAAVRLEQS